MSEKNNSSISFQIQRIYIKDISFEAPNVPHIFQKDWDPKVKLNLDTVSKKLADNVHEVVLRLTVSATVNEDTAFLCEAQQAGVFFISGIVGSQMDHCLNAYCPNVLFPYARECISNLVSRGTFPQFNLAPINFDMLFINSFQQKTNSTKEHDSNE